MAYCAKSDLVERYGAAELAQLTDETAAADPDSGEITKACDEASSLVDAYLATRYTVPLATVPTIVRQWACVIARKLLWKDRAKDGGAVQRAYDEALAQLRDASKGVIAVPDAAGDTPAVTGAAVAVVAASKVFTSTLLDTMPGSCA